jgi:DNA-directed RNA polymerase sigma subunit (sigma70/sigma32)
MVSCLDEPEILRLRFGLDGDEPLTLDQVGARFGISRERIRQIERAAFTRLQHPQVVVHHPRSSARLTRGLPPVNAGI